MGPAEPGPGFSAVIRATTAPSSYWIPPALESTTLDFWHSESAFESFYKANLNAYQAIDRSTEQWLSRETYLGSFNQTEPNKPSA